MKLTLEIGIPTIAILAGLGFILLFQTRGPIAVPVSVPHATSTPAVKRAPIIPKPPHTPVAITQVSPPVFAFAHGTAMADGTIFIGMANKSGNPFPANQIFAFTDPRDLTRFRILSIPRKGDIESMAYDAIHDRIYFTLSNEGSLDVFSLDPRQYQVNAVVSTTSIDLGPRSAIATDGAYIYGITNTDPSTVFKIRLSDYALTSSSIGHIPFGHSAAVGSFGSTTELYFGSGMSDRFEKADADTLAPLGTVQFPVCAMTDDMPFRKADDMGGSVYVGCEKQPYGYRIDTHDLSLKRFSLPGYSFGLFMFGDDLYNAAADGHYDVFHAMNVDAIKRYYVGSEMPLNELFYSLPTDSILFTAWWGIQGLFEVASSSMY